MAEEIKEKFKNFAEDELTECFYDYIFRKFCPD